MAEQRPILVMMHRADAGEFIPAEQKEHPMKIPVWIKPGIWGAVVGAIAIAIIGFSQLGWSTSGTAEKLA